MDKEIIVRLHSSFEDVVRKHAESGVEYWCARDLQILLGYTEWRNFAKVIDKAITACQNAGYEPRDHFVEINKMVSLGSGAERQITDIGLTRYACYLIAQNGDLAGGPVGEKGSEKKRAGTFSAFFPSLSLRLCLKTISDTHSAVSIQALCLLGFWLIADC